MSYRFKNWLEYVLTAYIVTFAAWLVIFGYVEIRKAEKVDWKMQQLRKNGTMARVTMAGWYDYDLEGGKNRLKTREMYSETHATAASREYTKGTVLQVLNPRNGKTVQVVVNDFGPDMRIFPERGMDLSSYAFSKISRKSMGVERVIYWVVSNND